MTLVAKLLSSHHCNLIVGTPASLLWGEVVLWRTDQYKVGVAPLSQAVEDLQSSIADTVVCEPRLLPSHPMCAYCWKLGTDA